MLLQRALESVINTPRRGASRNVAARFVDAAAFQYEPLFHTPPMLTSRCSDARDYAAMFSGAAVAMACAR